MLNAFRVTITAFITMVSGVLSAPEKVEEPPSRPDQEPAPAYPLVPTFLSYLKTDADKQSERGVQLLDVLLAGPYWEEAEALAAEISGFRKAVAYYRIAEARSRAGQNEAAKDALASASALPQGTLDHEKDEVFAARVGALAALGHRDEALDAGSHIFTPHLRIQALLDLTEFGEASEAEQRAREFLNVENGTPGQQGRAFLYAARVVLASGDKQNAARLAIEGATTASKAADDTTVSTLCDIAMVLQQAGNPDEAKRWTGVALGFVQHLDNRSSWKAGELRTVASTYRALGHEKEAVATFKLIPNAANSVDLMGMSTSGADLAVSFVQRGEMEKFEKTCLIILRTTRQHPHHRMRAMGALDVLAAHVCTGVLLSPVMQEELRKTAEAIEADPTYQNPT